MPVAGEIPNVMDLDINHAALPGTQKNAALKILGEHAREHREYVEPHGTILA
jgi:hypothetical protein